MSPFTFGVKKATMTDGTHMELPNTVRKQSHAQIVHMFKTYVKVRLITRSQLNLSSGREHG